MGVEGRYSYMVVGMFYKIIIWVLCLGSYGLCVVWPWHSSDLHIFSPNSSAVRVLVRFNKVFHPSSDRVFAEQPWSQKGLDPLLFRFSR